MAGNGYWRNRFDVRSASSASTSLQDHLVGEHPLRTEALRACWDDAGRRYEPERSMDEDEVHWDHF